VTPASLESPKTNGLSHSVDMSNDHGISTPSLFILQGWKVLTSPHWAPAEIRGRGTAKFRRSGVSRIPLDPRRFPTFRFFSETVNWGSSAGKRRAIWSTDERDSPCQQRQGYRPECTAVALIKPARQCAIAGYQALSIGQRAGTLAMVLGGRRPPQGRFRNAPGTASGAD
jgi:hypothetical protein